MELSECFVAIIYYWKDFGVFWLIRRWYNVPKVMVFSFNVSWCYPPSYSIKEILVFGLVHSHCLSFKSLSLSSHHLETRGRSCGSSLCLQLLEAARSPTSTTACRRSAWDSSWRCTLWVSISGLALHRKNSLDLGWHSHIQHQAVHTD